MNRVSSIEAVSWRASTYIEYHAYYRLYLHNMLLIRQFSTSLRIRHYIYSIYSSSKGFRICSFGRVIGRQYNLLVQAESNFYNNFMICTIITGFNAILRQLMEAYTRYTKLGLANSQRDGSSSLAPRTEKTDWYDIVHRCTSSQICSEPIHYSRYYI
jgi:hypothetical protein